MIKLSFCKKITIVALLAIVIVASMFCVASPKACVANAYTYGGKESDEIWHWGDNFLNVKGAKDVVSTWDLSGVEQVRIAVIDTGIDISHELFDGVLAKNDKDEVLGYNSSTGADHNGKVNISDESSKHGTSVAGSIAMLIKEFGLEEYIKIYPIKANTAGGDTFKIQSLTDSVNWAVKNADADVINMSLGYSGDDYKKQDASLLNAFEIAIENARRSAVVVAAAGNNSSDKNPFYPAVLSGVVSVMNHDKSGNIYKSSNFGAGYTLCAPGTDIYTAKGYVGERSTYGNVSPGGTSQASAMVSFATALLKIRLQAENKANDALTLAKIISSLDYAHTAKKGSNTFKMLDLLTIATASTDNLISYVNPTSMSIKHDGKMGSGDYSGMIYMRADSAYTITFTATLAPVGDVNPDVEKGIEWYAVRTKSIDDDTPTGESVLIGKGASIQYTPSIGGHYIVSAKLDGFAVEEQTCEIFVQYGNYYVGEVRVTLVDFAGEDVDNAPSNAISYAGDTTTFALTGVKYLNPDVETKWFVNGEYVASGATFDFEPSKSGTYVVTAQYGDNAKVDFDFKFTLTVKVFSPLNLALLIVGLSVGVGAIVAVSVVALRKKKAKAQTNQTQYEKE